MFLTSPLTRVSFSCCICQRLHVHKNNLPLKKQLPNSFVSCEIEWNSGWNMRADRAFVSTSCLYSAWWDYRKVKGSSIITRIFCFIDDTLMLACSFANVVRFCSNKNFSVKCLRIKAYVQHVIESKHKFQE